MFHSSSRPGYIFLIAVLALGAIGIMTVTSLLLLGWAAEQNGQLIARSHQAYENASACAERALLALRDNPAYAGGEEIVLDNGSCAIEPVAGSGNEDRGLCITGTSGNVVRRMELDILRIIPSFQIRRWEEVPAFTLCL